jgi:hypothetical protein
MADSRPTTTAENRLQAQVLQDALRRRSSLHSHDAAYLALHAAAARLVREADTACGRCTLKRMVQKARGDRCGGCFQGFVAPLREVLANAR